MIVLLQRCGTNTDGRVACLKTVVPFFFVSVKKKEGEVDLIMIQLNLS
jgi:hypothetical protein